MHLILSSNVTDRVLSAVILIGALTIECEVVTVVVRGNVIGAFQTAAGAPQPLNAAFSTVNLNFQQTSTGLQHLKLILMPGSTAPTEYFLESSINGGAFEPAAEIANARLDLFTLSGGKEDNIELVEP